jgi:epidermal growth factor receptor substrate 15
LPTTSSPPPTQSPASPAPSNRVPPLSAADREQYRNMFSNMGARDGLLDGEQARTVFIRARLPNETLGQIWYYRFLGYFLTSRGLADMHNRGALDITEFTIAMHLIQSLMSSQISTVPASLPPELFAAASVTTHAPFTPVRQNSVQRTPSVSSTGSGRIAPQVPPKIHQSPVRAEFTGGSQAGFDGWDVTPQSKAAFDESFRTIDTSNKGYIDGITTFCPTDQRSRGSQLLPNIKVTRRFACPYLGSLGYTKTRKTDKGYICCFNVPDSS